MFSFMKPTKPQIDILNDTVQELYSLLSIASSSQQIVISIDEPLKADRLVVRINGRMWTRTDNPMTELRELHNILAINIKLGRTITMGLE